MVSARSSCRYVALHRPSVSALPLTWSVWSFSSRHSQRSSGSPPRARARPPQPPTRRPRPPTRRTPVVFPRSGNAKGARDQPGPLRTSSRSPSGVAGGLQLARLDDLGTMTAGHQLLSLDDLHWTVLPAWVNSSTADQITITGCRHTRQPITLSRDRDPLTADRERARRRIRRRVSGATLRRKVLLLVPAVRAGLAGPLLGRRLPQLRAVALTRRALCGRPRAPGPPWSAGSAEPRLGAGGKRFASYERAAPAWSSRLLRSRRHEPGPARAGLPRRDGGRTSGAGYQSRFHAPRSPRGPRPRPRNAAPPGPAARQYAGRFRPARGGA